MDFEHSAKALALRDRLEAFMEENIYPNEARFFAESMDLGPWRVWLSMFVASLEATPGSVIANDDRMQPARSGSSQVFCCSGVP